MAITVDYISDWKGRLRSKLYEQFGSLPNMIAMSDLFARQFQDLENSGQTLFSITSIDDSEGVNLDVIGRIIDQLRLGVDDATYRLFLKAKVRANKSSGTPEEIYSVFRALLGNAISMIYIPGNDAGFELQIRDPISALFASVAAQLLGIAKMAGVKGNLDWQETTDDQMFYTAIATSVQFDRIIGTNSIPVLDSSDFPASGSLTLDPGLFNEETFGFTNGVGIFFLSGSTLFAHSKNAVVELVGDPGQGFGTATSLASPASVLDSFVFVNEYTDFPEPGTVVIDQGLSTEETIEYFSHGGGALNLVTEITIPHSTGAIVQLVGTNTGGELAGSVAT